ncbi:YopX family protein [Lactococcus laudensis]|nr:hypothetical protein [Lactococcus laudensis]
MELKFRVYDRKYKSMDDVVQLDWWYDDLRVNDDTFSDYVVMQSTGLHDKNGVEIFEGDIVNVDRTFRNPMTGSGTLTLNKNFEVVFINGMFTRDGTSMGLSKDLKCLTVVGDVYQNPELLEDV